MNTTPWPEDSTPANQTSVAGDLTQAQERSVRLALDLARARLALSNLQGQINEALFQHPDHNDYCESIELDMPCDCWRSMLTAAIVEARKVPGVLTDGSDLSDAPGGHSVAVSGGVA